MDDGRRVSHNATQEANAGRPNIVEFFLNGVMQKGEAFGIIPGAIGLKCWEELSGHIGFNHTEVDDADAALWVNHNIPEFHIEMDHIPFALEVAECFQDDRPDIPGAGKVTMGGEIRLDDVVPAVVEGHYQKRCSALEPSFIKTNRSCSYAN